MLPDNIVEACFRQVGLTILVCLLLMWSVDVAHCILPIIVIQVSVLLTDLFRKGAEHRHSSEHNLGN